MDGLRLDVLWVWRSVRARPTPTIAMALVLALGIGLVSAMFALADPYLFRPLPYASPKHLVVVTPQPAPTFRPAQLSVPTEPSLPTLTDWQARTDLFSAVGAYRPRNALRLRLGTGAVSLRTAEVTPNFFDLLGTSWAVGASREWAEADGATPLILTSRAVDRLFGDRRGVIGRTLTRQDGGAVRVAAVLPPTFVFPSDRTFSPFEAFLIGQVERMVEAQRSGDARAVAVTSLTVVARLRDGVTPGAAQAALSAALPDPRALRIGVQPVTTYMTRRVRPVASRALVAGVLIWLISVGNVASLVLARSIYRRREFATREALGASRADLARLVLVELALVTSGAVGAGLWLAKLALDVARVVMPAEYAALGEPTLTSRVAAFAGAAGVLVMLCGLLPAWAASRVSPGALVGQSAGRDPRRVRVLRVALAATQSALALVLLVSGAFLGRSYVNLVTQDTGFSGHVVVMTVSYPDDRVGVGLQRDVDLTIDRLRRLVGVREAAAAIGPMLDRFLVFGTIVIDGAPVSAVPKWVTPDYFAAVGMQRVGGRLLDAADGGRSAVVVNEALARRYWPQGSPIGRRIGFNQETEVVGIVRDTFDVALDRPPEPTVFWLLENPSGCLGDCNNVSYVLRVADSAPDVSSWAGRAVASVNPDAVVVDISPLGERLAGSIKHRSFATLVVTVFATAGVTLCAVGLAGLVGFIASRRTREIAICVALGATPRHVVQMVMGEALAAMTLGLVMGLVGGHMASGVLAHLLYGLRPGDKPTVAVAAVVLLGVNLVASGIPAIRGLRVSPSVALRVE